MGRRERMKRGRGMNGRVERSRGIEIRIAYAFAIIKIQVPFFFLGPFVTPSSAKICLSLSQKGTGVSVLAIAHH